MHFTVVIPSSTLILLLQAFNLMDALSPKDKNALYQVKSIINGGHFNNFVRKFPDQAGVIMDTLTTLIAVQPPEKSINNERAVVSNAGAKTFVDGNVKMNNFTKEFMTLSEALNFKFDVMTIQRAVKTVNSVSKVSFTYTITYICKHVFR